MCHRPFGLLEGCWTITARILTILPRCMRRYMADWASQCPCHFEDNLITYLLTVQKSFVLADTVLEKSVSCLHMSKDIFIEPEQWKIGLDVVALSAEEFMRMDKLWGFDMLNSSGSTRAWCQIQSFVGTFLITRPCIKLCMSQNESGHMHCILLLLSACKKHKSNLKLNSHALSAQSENIFCCQGSLSCATICTTSYLPGFVFWLTEVLASHWFQ